MYLTASVLIAFSGVFWLAERYGTQQRSLERVTMRDAITMGLAQVSGAHPRRLPVGCVGQCRLFVGLDREAAFRLSFLLAIPAVFGAGLFQPARRLPPQQGGPGN